MQDEFPTQNNIILLSLLYFLLFLDNVLLTVVVPIIPDFLFAFNISAETSKINVQNSTRLGPQSLSPLQQKFELLEHENGLLGVLLSSKAFVQLAFTPLSGYLTEIFGYQLFLLIGSCCMFLATILFAYGKTYGVLVLARALHGSSSSAITVSGISLLAKIMPKKSRSTLMPIAFGGVALGVLIGYPLGGAVYQYFGKSAPFLLIGFLVIWQMYWSAENMPAYLPNEKFNLNSYYYLLKDPKILVSTLAICVNTSTMAILEPCVPMWLIENLKPPPSRWQLGAVFIPDSVGYLIGSHCAGLISIASWRMAIIALIIAGLSCSALPLITSYSQLTFPHFGIGLSVGIVDAVLIPYLATLVDRQTSEGCNYQYGPVYALQQSFVSVAYAFGPLMSGRAIHFIGFSWLIRLVGFMNLAYCPILLVLEDVTYIKEKKVNIESNNDYISLGVPNSTKQIPN